MPQEAGFGRDQVLKGEDSVEEVKRQKERSWQKYSLEGRGTWQEKNMWRGKALRPTYVLRDFACAVPSAWNSSPSMCEWFIPYFFRSLLKTHLQWGLLWLPYINFQPLPPLKLHITFFHFRFSLWCLSLYNLPYILTINLVHLFFH